VGRTERTTLEAGVPAPSGARHWVSDLLGRWGLSYLSEVATILTSEVVTNAVSHAATSPTLGLRASLADGFLEVGVKDGDRGHLPHMSDAPDPTDEGGRGLILVDGMAESWGTSLRPQGKEVWFRLAAGGTDP
jgi:anti-sigma regulatory factor (Ser/Thr protein kinase)